MRLKRFENIRALGDEAKVSKKEVRQMQAVKDGKFETVNILYLTVSQLVDMERYLLDFDYCNFCRIFVKKNWFKILRVCHLTAILTDFKNQKEELTALFQWVFNPPSYGEPTKETVGSELRNDFVKEFGNYVVLTDLLVSKTGLSYKELERWTVEDFFFWANYYSGQKIVEQVK